MSLAGPARMGGWRALLASNTSLHRRPHGRCLLEWLAVWAGLAWAGLAGLGWPAGLSWLGGMGRLSWAGLGWLPLIEAPPIPRRAQKSVSDTTWVAIRNLKFIPGNSRMPPRDYPRRLPGPCESLLSELHENKLLSDEARGLRPTGHAKLDEMSKCRTS